MGSVVETDLVEAHSFRSAFALDAVGPLEQLELPILEELSAYQSDHLGRRVAFVLPGSVPDFCFLPLTGSVPFEVLSSIPEYPVLNLDLSQPIVSVVPIF